MVSIDVEVDHKPIKLSPEIIATRLAMQIIHIGTVETGEVKALIIFAICALA